MNRLSPIFTSTDSAAVMAEINRLSELYRGLNRGRPLPQNLLLFASWGDRRNAMYGITLTWEDDQCVQAQWVKENVMESEGAEVGV